MSDQAEQSETEAAPDPQNVDTEVIEKEREERLDPENRPDLAEIDNSDRDFDPATGMFTDNDDHDAAPEQFADEDLGEDSDGESEDDSDGDD